MSLFFHCLPKCSYIYYTYFILEDFLNINNLNFKINKLLLKFKFYIDRLIYFYFY